MAICSGRKKPNAYDECDLDNVTDYEYYESLFWFKSWKKFNDLSSKTVIDNTSLPVFRPYWLDSDDQTES